METLWGFVSMDEAEIDTELECPLELELWTPADVSQVDREWERLMTDLGGEG